MLGVSNETVSMTWRQMKMEVFWSFFKSNLTENNLFLFRKFAQFLFQLNLIFQIFSTLWVTGLHIVCKLQFNPEKNESGHKVEIHKLIYK